MSEREGIMETSIKLARIDLQGIANLASKWLAETPMEIDAVNHLRYFYMVEDTNHVLHQLDTILAKVEV
jgi:hypothetical protein